MIFDYNTGINNYVSKKFNTAKNNFLKCIEDNTNIELSKVYVVLCDLYLNSIDVQSLKFLDEVYATNLDLIKREFFAYLKNKDLPQSIKESNCFNVIFTKDMLKTIDKYIKKLSYFCDVNEITENEKLLSLYYKDTYYVFASLFLYSKKFTDDDYHNIKIEDTEIQIFKTLDDKNFYALVDMLNSAHFIIEQKTVNEYSKNYNYNFSPIFNMFYDFEESFSNSNFNNCAVIVSNIEKLSKIDVVTFRRLYQFKTRLGLVNNDFNVCYDNIKTLITNVTNEDGFTKEIIVNVIDKFKDIEDTRLEELQLILATFK